MMVLSAVAVVINAFARCWFYRPGRGDCFHRADRGGTFALGLDARRFEGRLQSSDTRASLGIATGVHATQSIVVNVRLHVGRLSEAEVRCVGARDSMRWSITQP